ncbi:rhodanese-related sulfurtransferase [Breznakia sp. PF5-3]|uniref:rhodanese-like domain-containing protein n=1 Tax=unclassified Breznakia TaxID=2623764 RepID=UPI0024075274|nr:MULTISPECIES: rhodanese-like domain-containing protein [unclassified Breznakia]MDF9824169.1 rhodanese-related sulfurtransferase [Breznakia sp. PM6-1]MDF9834967.1 rhodanese-related sulfurtransferase [Breznakia sp. PF5-3]MDF9837164.1 rhodanese-related sulfurtransferase [Breznakia sp. PFB2-8]MDF9859154.1 rhodanese-related sulfurtransferase [Breznakia sp. PH5-24]
MFFSKIKSISAVKLQELVEQGDKTTILDVREKDEFKDGHIKSAINAPLSNIENTKLKGTTYVICQSGMRSKQACHYLSKQGYDVINVSGGMSSWRGKIV